MLDDIQYFILLVQYYLTQMMAKDLLVDNSVLYSMHLYKR